MNKIPNYRVWHKIEKRFVDLRSIDFEQDSIGYDCYREANYYDVAKFDEIVFQQSTGLKDKNGKEIFEGDRVRFAYTENRDFFGEVVYFEDRATFGVKSKNAGENFEDLAYHMKYFEVVGNVFELPCNPDHNGECLVCDCWLSDCEFNKEKVEDDLQKLVKEDPMWQKPLANNVQEDYDDSLEYVAYYRSSDGAVFRKMIGTNKFSSFRSDQLGGFISTVYTADEIRTFVNSGSMVGISKTYYKES